MKLNTQEKIELQILGIAIFSGIIFIAYTLLILTLVANYMIAYAG